MMFVYSFVCRLFFPNAVGGSSIGASRIVSDALVLHASTEACLLLRLRIVVKY